jgi:isopropylmalate/homocitrate/citramalate synthase
VALPRRVKLVEVGPRDGLQNEAKTVAVAVRAEFIERLATAGLAAIEAGAFVSPKRVPQMADTAPVLAHIRRRKGVAYPVLVPNRKGFDAALIAGARDIAVFTAATESFTRANTNCTVEESLARCAELCEAAKRHGIGVRGYISCVLGCPYEGEVKPEVVVPIAERLFSMGCFEVSLGDTVGVGTPLKARSLVAAVAARVPRERLAVHFHDTYGQALANIFAVIEKGIGIVDSSVAGLGGCPYAPGAAGNVASEDVLYMLNGLGVETGVDLAVLLDASRFITGHLGRAPASRVALAARSAGAT